MAETKITLIAPEEFLKPENFKTSMDTPELDQKQYEKGLKLSNKSDCVGISANGCWFADLIGGGHMSSYEVIGFHSSTAELLRGLLAGTAKFIVYRNTSEGFIRTDIKG